MRYGRLMQVLNIQMDLSQQSIEKAIDQLERFQSEQKLKEFTQKLAEKGVSLAKAAFSSVSGYEGDTNVAVDMQQDGNGYVIRASGTDVLFIEFGAGITYSEPQHPQAGELGYGPGTYPGGGHGLDYEGWYYYANEQDKLDHKLSHSYGNPAYMPMYSTAKQLRNEIISTFREVFMK